MRTDTLKTQLQAAERWDWYALVFVAVTSLLRLTQLSRYELAPDEAYYWDWSRQLDWGYYDQGPMIAYVIRLTTGLCGTGAFGVRIGVWAASLGTILCCWLLARRLFGARAAFITTLALGATPLMAVGSLIATYDPLLVVFWALALVFLERALFAPTEAAQRRAWLWTGAATGLGFLSKHTMLLLLPCVLLFLAVSPPHRHWLRRPHPYLAVLITLLLYGGAFWWNAHHDWWTFGHLLFLANKSKNTPLSRLGEFLGSQALLLGPGLFLAAIYAGYRTLRTKEADGGRGGEGENQNTDHSSSSDVLCDLNSARRFLFCMGFPVLFFFCLMALRAKVQANWAPCAWLTPCILWAGMIADKSKGKREKGKGEIPDSRQGKAAAELKSASHALRSPFSLFPFPFALVIGTSALLTLLLVSPELRQMALLRIKPKDDITTQMAGWKDLAAHVQKVRGEMSRGNRPVFLAANGYQYCALMGFYLPDRPPSYDLYLHYRLTMYAAQMERLQKHFGEDAVFLNDGEADDHDLRLVFQRVEWDPPYPIYQRPYHTDPVRIIHIARCYGYRRYTGTAWAVGG